MRYDLLKSEFKREARQSYFVLAQIRVGRNIVITQIKIFAISFLKTVNAVTIAGPASYAIHHRMYHQFLQTLARKVSIWGLEFGPNMVNGLLVVLKMGDFNFEKPSL